MTTGAVILNFARNAAATPDAFDACVYEAAARYADELNKYGYDRQEYIRSRMVTMLRFRDQFAQAVLHEGREAELSERQPRSLQDILQSIIDLQKSKIQTSKESLIHHAY